MTQLRTLPLILTLSILLTFVAVSGVSSASHFQMDETVDETGDDPFVVVNEEAGIEAVHEGSWDEFHPHREFTDGYQVTGQAWADYDNDGWSDLYVTGGLAPSVLYRNNGDGSFSVSPLSNQISLPDVWTGGAVWADYDNDGWKDLYVLAHGANVLLHNEGAEGFTNVTDVAGVGDPGKGTTAAWGDYDGDTLLDLYVANWSCYPACDPVDFDQSQDRLYHNLGDGTFEDVSEELGIEKLQGAGFSVAFFDYDNDRDADIFVVNDKLQNPIGNVLWRNDGPADGDQDEDGWLWTDVSEAAGVDSVIHGMGLAVGDYDNDSDLDLYYSNMVDPSVLQQNQLDSLTDENEVVTFVDRSADAGLPTGPTEQVGWGVSFLDYDNDGWQDLFTSTTGFVNLTPMTGPVGMMLDYPNVLYRNQSDGTFEESTPASWTETPRASVGFASADYDRDGRIDFVTGDWNEGYRLYRNQGETDETSHWLEIRLIGDSSKVNRDGIGTRVFLRLTDGRTLMQEVRAGTALGSGSETMLHFGLGEAAVTRAIVVWPNGLKRTYIHVPKDRIWHVSYPGLEDDPILATYRESFVEPYVDVTAEAGIDTPHQGTWKMFHPDFTTGYLGVGQAWGDYNGDGWVDLYVTGNELPNTLYRNNQDGTFDVSGFSNLLSMPDQMSGGAVWADYDNDGWKDLYVLVHGDNVLFRNEAGKGFRDVTEEAGVASPGKSSTATWGDYDNDGFIDLFVANWACYPECDPIDFEQSQDRLYHNNGDGTFEDVTDLLVHEKLLGAGFTASFVDYDSDLDLDLYVVNDSLYNPVGNVLWRNDGPGCGNWCWSDASEETGAGIVIEGMGLAVGDYDNDLDLDLYFSNMVNPSALVQNLGDGSFEEISEIANAGGGLVATVGWGTAFLDYDNDGWQDLFLSTTEVRNMEPGTPPDGMHFDHPNLLFHNDQNGTFSNASPTIWLEEPQPSMGMAYADYDRDGWLDIVTGDWNREYKLYRNQSKELQDNNWLTVRLTGAGSINRDAIGSRVYVTTADGRSMMQEIKSGSSLGAGNDTALHFGLGDSTVDELSVVWPNGNRVYYRGISPNQEWTLAYPGFN